MFECVDWLFTSFSGDNVAVDITNGWFWNCKFKHIFLKLLLIFDPRLVSTTSDSEGERLRPSERPSLKPPSAGESSFLENTKNTKYKYNNRYKEVLRLFSWGGVARYSSVICVTRSFCQIQLLDKSGLAAAVLRRKVSVDDTEPKSQIKSLSP